MAELLDYEIKLFEDLQEEKQRLDDLDLSAETIISYIDASDQTGNINFNNLRRYLNECGILPYDSEIISLLRRVDRDDDGVLALPEFSRFLSKFSKFGGEGKEPARSSRNRRLSRKMRPLMSPSRRKVVNTKIKMIQSTKRADKSSTHNEITEVERDSNKENTKIVSNQQHTRVNM